MIPKPSILYTLLLFSVFLFSFRKMGKTSDKISLLCLADAQQQSVVDTGRIVSVDSIESCLRNYTQLMADHGFSNPGGQPYTSTITKTSQLTASVSFSGTDLHNWIKATEASYAHAGKNFSIRIEFGAYDSVFLKTYEPDPAERIRKNNRIAIFLVPYDAATGLTLQSQSNIAGGSSSGVGGAYDFGGLQP